MEKDRRRGEKEEKEMKEEKEKELKGGSGRKTLVLTGCILSEKNSNITTKKLTLSPTLIMN